MGPVVQIKDVQMVPTNKLVPNPKNPNKHPPEQIKRLAEVIEAQGWRRAITVSNRSGFVTVGHGRLEAAKLKSWEQVPVTFQDYENEALEYADMVADNALNDWSELDLSMINADVPEFGPDFDIDLLGLKDFTLDISDKISSDGSAEDLYTKKIKSPIYEPKGEKPSEAELYDLTKTVSLINEIRTSDIPEEIRQFLELAAHRHIVFNYEKVAEYYAHAPKEIQELMENSALIIIDFKKAIENGFVNLTKEIAEGYTKYDSDED